jgi:hypothetical protein
LQSSRGPTSQIQYHISKTTDLNWSTTVITEYTYLYFFDELSCCPLHSLHLLVDGDLFVVDIVVSTLMETYMCCRPSCGCPWISSTMSSSDSAACSAPVCFRSWCSPASDDVTADFPLAAASGRPPCVKHVVAVVCSGTL